MRGTKAKRLRKAGLKSGPAPKPEAAEHVPPPKTGWKRRVKVKKDLHNKDLESARSRRLAWQERNLKKRESDAGS